MAASELKTRDECLTVMSNKSLHMTTDHCPLEWDQYTEMCWGPTPAGESAILPCPDDGFLNPKQFATRICLPDSSWYINYTFDDKPYTNFQNCFLPEDPTAEDDLKKLIDTKIIFVLKTLDEYKRAHLAIYAVSIILLIASVFASISGIVKLNAKKHPSMTYLALTIAAAALLIHNVTTLSLNGVDDATKLFKCRFAKFISLICTLVFHESIFVYIFLCIASILHIPIRLLVIQITAAATVFLTVLLATTELLLETFSCSYSRHCGFKTLQSAFHWLTTAPRILLIMVCLCLASVTVFGAFCLKQPNLSQRNELYKVRQRSLSALVLVVYSVAQEVMLVLIHTEAYMNYSDLPVEEYVSVFSLATSAQGIIFSVIMCVLDIGLLTMLGLSIIHCPGHDTTSEQELNAFPKHTALPLHVRHGKSAISDQV
ncbi:unnamed protein product [Candidula unifasciata]|uniref:G-protein coupled receptors family 2 profile 1 domain-containing protein n=1 Tax=Candidula unifasciata TaxID=100452 RepID=A0A8S3ZDH3_9EUPU|nr:unnamed protein product [Candidula unifasciata]